MKTYRSGTNWNASTWPGSGETPDTTTWQYDAASGLLTNKLYADNTSVSYSYTTAGKLATRTWARTDAGTGLPLQTLYSYNTAGELTGINYSDATPDVSFTYDRLGRQLTASSAISSHEFAYNEYLQLESETISTAGATNLLTRSFDNLGRNTGLALNDDYSVSYEFDTYGRFSSLTSSVLSVSSVVNYSYLENSDLLSGHTIGNMSITRSYESNRNLITEVLNQYGTNVVSRYEYTSDSLGRRTERLDSGQAFASILTNSFGYNSRNELTSAQINTNGQSYSYDPIGNRQTSTNNADGLLSYTANNLNQYTAITNGSGQTLTYNADGSLTNDGTFTYRFNCDNRLIEVEPLSPDTNSYKVAFTYDFQGRRVEKKLFGFDGTNWNGTADESRYFVYDGWNLIQETIKTPSSTNNQQYVWGLDLSGSLQGAGGIGGLLAWIRECDTNLFLYCFDGNGNVGQILNSTDGTIDASYEYSGFGRIIVSSGNESTNNVWRFSTKYFDADIGLSYYGHRYYDAPLGRWLSRDPIGEEGGLNMYSFVENASIQKIDMLGHKVEKLEIRHSGPAILNDTTYQYGVDAYFKQFVTGGLGFKTAVVNDFSTYEDDPMGTGRQFPVKHAGNRVALFKFEYVAESICAGRNYPVFIEHWVMSGSGLFRRKKGSDGPWKLTGRWTDKIVKYPHPDGPENYIRDPKDAHTGASVTTVAGDAPRFRIPLDDRFEYWLKVIFKVVARDKENKWEGQHKIVIFMDKDGARGGAFVTDNPHPVKGK